MGLYESKMSDSQCIPGGSGDKLISLTKEAECLKLRLEEERQKLNDVSCKFNSHKQFHIALLFRTQLKMLTKLWTISSIFSLREYSTIGCRTLRNHYLHQY